MDKIGVMLDFLILVRTAEIWTYWGLFTLLEHPQSKAIILSYLDDKT